MRCGIRVAGHPAAERLLEWHPAWRLRDHTLATLHQSPMGRPPVRRSRSILEMRLFCCLAVHQSESAGSCCLPMPPLLPCERPPQPGRSTLSRCAGDFRGSTQRINRSVMSCRQAALRNNALLEQIDEFLLFPAACCGVGCDCPALALDVTACCQAATIPAS